ncbi:hypothetical protein N824_20725 [Pedobacter sp. V48]|nr:hypothetical protein N824_20725 [Pedobacter sp. V48]
MVLTAFCSAVFTNFSTELTKLFCAVNTQAHQLLSSITYRCTFHIQSDAFRHHFHIRFSGAGAGAVIAS